MRNNRLWIAKIVFKNENYITYKSFNKERSKYQIDHTLVSLNANKLVTNYKINKDNSIHSDH